MLLLVHAAGRWGLCVDACCVLRARAWARRRTPTLLSTACSTKDAWGRSGGVCLGMAGAWLMAPRGSSFHPPSLVLHAVLRRCSRGDAETGALTARELDHHQEPSRDMLCGHPRRRSAPVGLLVGEWGCEAAQRAACGPAAPVLGFHAPSTPAYAHDLLARGRVRGSGAFSRTCAARARVFSRFDALSRVAVRFPLRASLLRCSGSSCGAASR